MLCMHACMYVCIHTHTQLHIYTRGHTHIAEASKTLTEESIDPFDDINLHAFLEMQSSLFKLRQDGGNFARIVSADPQ